MDATLRNHLLVLRARDEEARARLAADGRLFDGYHPEMQTVHEANAAELDRFIAEQGWPDRDLAGEDGAEAAWLIAQHAIGLPPFQRRCLALLEAAVAAGRAPAWQAAMMLDRVRSWEGRPQVYGTQFDWDEDGRMSPRPIEDSEGVDDRRAAVGLETLAAATIRLRAPGTAGPTPENLAERERHIDQWAREVGWR